MEKAEKRKVLARGAIDKVKALFTACDGFFQCSVENSCTYRPSNLVVGNALRHIREAHPINYNVLELGPQIPEEELKTLLDKKRVKKSPVDDGVLVRISRQKVIGGLIKLVTVHGVPFTAVQWEGLRDIIDPIMSALKIKLNNHNIVDWVHAANDAVDDQIRDELHGQMLSLQMDTTSKASRSVLGVSTQHYDGMKLIRRSLGIVELFEKQTAQYLKQNVNALCDKFDIKPWQIYNVTVDNGRNVVKAVELLQDQEELDPDDLEPECNQDDVPNNHGDDIDQIVEEYQASLSVDCVRCGAHTVNLVVNDTIKKCSQVEETLKEITTIVKAYRKTAYKQYFILSRAPKPPIANKTRWNNYYDMNHVLLKHKDFYDGLAAQHSVLDLSKHWEFIEEFEYAFRPLYETSIRVQSIECPISQFHLEWLKAYGRIVSMKENRFKKQLMDSMEHRQATLMSSDAYKASLYMDPRFTYNGSGIFSEEQKEEIAKFLMSLWRRISSHATDQPNNPEHAPQDVHSVEPELETSFNLNDFITKMFGEGKSSTTQVADEAIYHKIRQIQFQPRVSATDTSFNIIAYWYSYRIRDPVLWEIARVVFAAASTQVVVERDFSHYNHIFTQARNQLAPKTVESILKIKLNEELLDTAIMNVCKTTNERLTEGVSGSSQTA